VAKIIHPGAGSVRWPVMEERAFCGLAGELVRLFASYRLGNFVIVKSRPL
jgi:hypothetical protein